MDGENKIQTSRTSGFGSSLFKPGPGTSRPKFDTVPANLPDPPNTARIISFGAPARNRATTFPGHGCPGKGAFGLVLLRANNIATHVFLGGGALAAMEYIETPHEN